MTEKTGDTKLVLGLALWAISYVMGLGRTLKCMIPSGPEQAYPTKINARFAVNFKLTL